MYALLMLVAAVSGWAPWPPVAGRTPARDDAPRRQAPGARRGQPLAAPKDDRAGLGGTEGLGPRRL